VKINQDISEGNELIASAIYLPRSATRGINTDATSLVSEVLSLSLYKKKGQSIFGKHIVEEITVNEATPSIEISFGEVAIKSSNIRDFACASYNEAESMWMTEGMTIELAKSGKTGIMKATCSISTL